MGWFTWENGRLKFGGQLQARLCRGVPDGNRLFALCNFIVTNI